MMNFLLAFCPFHPPTSPPLGSAYIKAAVQHARPHVTVKTVDWNLDFFRRWLLGEPPHLCDDHPSRLLGRVCPNLLVEHGQGKEIWNSLTAIPEGSEEVNRYITGAKLIDEVYRSLAGFFDELLIPFIEQKSRLDADSIDRLFSTELGMIENERPDLLGFSILAEQNLVYSLALARAAKERVGSPVALGGALMSHLDPREILRAFPWVDFVFTGEAEESIVGFFDALDSAVDALRTVAGLAYRDGNGDPICRPPGAPPDLGSLPFPDFSDCRIHDYLSPAPLLPLMTCRGCYWGKCAFCSHTLPFAKGVRVRAAKHVVEEIFHQTTRHGVRHFLFVDEAMSPRTLHRMSEEIERRGLDIVWGAEGIRVERAFDVRMLGRAHAAGLRWVYVGIESSVQRLLDLIEKGVDIATIEEFTVACGAVGIVPQLSFIVGIPGTTREELEREIAFMSRRPVDTSSFVLLFESPMHRRSPEFGIRVEDRQVLFETPAGTVHAPRFHFTAREGLSPPVADRIVEDRIRQSARPRMRPHLGEVHATILAATGFFDSDARPPEPSPAAARAWAHLARDPDGDDRTALHAAGCLEAMGNLERAFDLVEGALAQPGTRREQRRNLLIHRAALYNRAGRPDLARATALEVAAEHPGDPAIEAELAAASYGLGDVQATIEHAAAALAAGREIENLHGMLAQSYEALGRHTEALNALQAAERCNWIDHGINLTQARVLEELNRLSEAREAESKAERKRAFFAGA